MIKKTIRIILLFVLILGVFCVSGCKDDSKIYENAGVLDPDSNKILSDEPRLNFTDMHNFVIDSISEEYTPFFYIVEGKFDISGDNEKKNIVLTVTCMDGTTVEDLDLFLSMALNYAGINASEQDFRFKKPTVDIDGTYLDFGTVFDTYSLDINAKDESGNVLRNDHIKAGGKNPVDPRYIKE